MNEALLKAQEDEMIRLFKEGWVPADTVSNAEYSVTEDFKEEFSRDGFTVVPTPAFRAWPDPVKDLGGTPYYVKGYPVPCDLPAPNTCQWSVWTAGVYPIVRDFCKKEGITHVYNVTIWRHAACGLISPKLSIIVSGQKIPIKAVRSSEEEPAPAKGMIRCNQCKKEYDKSALFRGKCVMCYALDAHSLWNRLQSIHERLSGDMSWIEASTPLWNARTKVPLAKDENVQKAEGQP